MTATDHRTFRQSFVSRPTSSAARGGCRETRFTNLPDAVLAKAFAGDPVLPSDYRETFARRFCRANRAVFACHDDVAAFYDITGRQARNLWAGLHVPSGDKVARFAVSFPETFVHHCGDGA